MLPALWSSTAPLQPECTHAPLLFGCRLSVAECGRVQGLYLTKQIFIAMVTVCLMLAADRANVVSGRARHCWNTN